ncbi:MAG: hypothetical protein MUE71_01620 [Chitinophagaceae bacterium]|jgi:hypothetical protein|nr:hypothetical protein [Chitinophagaceae bacterium]MCU0404160.1 hypothetical protein [Chitinophagaceae bacterium]
MSNHTPALHAPIWRRTAQVISYLLHPLFVPAMVAGIILLRHPLYTLLLDEPARFRLFVMVLINTILFPALIAFLLWRLGFTRGLQLETQRERIFPLVANIIFYFWAWNVARNLDNVPVPLVQWLMGIFLCSSAAMFMNIFMKISLHTIGMGGLVAFSFLMMANDPFWPSGILSAALILAGLTGTARLLREAHNPSEVYAGYFAGALCVVAGWFIAG